MTDPSKVMKKKKTGFGTNAVHEGEGNFSFHPSSTPIYQSSTFYFDTIEEAGRVNQGAQKGFVYTRIGNPTIEAFEKKLAALEEAEGAVAFASGMAALASVILEVLAPGDEMISSSRIYGGSKGFFDQILKKHGCLVRFFDPQENVQEKNGCFLFNDPFNGPVYLKQKGSALVGVLNTSDEKTALGLLTTTTEKLP